MLRSTTPSTLINNSSRPLIFIGSNSNLYQYTEICQLNGIDIAGIMDSDYYGNTDSYCEIPLIDTEESLYDAEKLKTYQEKYNFFCATNWSPEQDADIIRNRQKRHKLIDLIDQFDLRCISLVGPVNFISPSTNIGKGVFIDSMVHVGPRASIGDFVNIQAMSCVGPNATIGRNCTLQRLCCISDVVVGENSYFAPMTKALKNKAVFGANTFIHEGIYIKRGTVDNEIVSMDQGNRHRVMPYVTA